MLHPVHRELTERFPGLPCVPETTRDGCPTLWLPGERLAEVLTYLKQEASPPFPLLFDLAGVDERTRRARPPGAPACDFSLIYQVISPDRPTASRELRLRVALTGERPTARSITGLWPSASWYAREAWDLLGIAFTDHPGLRRLLLPDYWEGHPLRKDQPYRRTELGPFRLGATPQQERAERLDFGLEEWDLRPLPPGEEAMHLNLGPHHTGTHGLIRFLLQLQGEVIHDVGVQIGFHHRGQEKLAERQTFASYLPYADRLDYLAGVNNELPYLLAVERLAGIDVPPRAQAIRVLLAELFRVANHLVFLGTFAGDLGAQSPIFYTFNDRERVLHVIEAITGFRMHPGWLRLGGVADDLPTGWEGLLRELLDYLPRSLRDYRRGLFGNRILQGRTRGIGALTTREALDWGITGPNLRATGLAWDLRRERPYCGYEQLEFAIPTATSGDSYDRALLRLEEIAESLRILRQLGAGMPAGPYKSTHPLASPPEKHQGTTQAIETLIHHFVGVSWGKPLPVGEAQGIIEAPKGMMGYLVVSDGGIHSYRTRIRTPTFPLLQAVPSLARGLLISDLIAILGSIDYVMGDVDR